MGIQIMDGEDVYLSTIEAALEGRIIAYLTEDGVARMQRAQTLVSILSGDQKNDFLTLRSQGFVILPAGITTNRLGDIGQYLLSLSPQEFLKYYIMISRERESKRGVKRILESQR